MEPQKKRQVTIIKAVALKEPKNSTSPKRKIQVTHKINEHDDFDLLEPARIGNTSPTVKLDTI